MRLGRADEAEPFDDLVRHECRVRVPGAAVMAVVVLLPGLDIVGQFVGDHAGVLAVAGDEVGDVVADHPAEPAALVEPVRVRLGAAVGHVRRRRDADRDAGRDRDRRPRRRVRTALTIHSVEERIGQLEDVAVGLAPGQLQRLGAVGGHPDRQAPSLTHGIRMLVPPNSASRPSARSLMTCMASPSSAERRRACVRRRASPSRRGRFRRSVRLPYMSLSVAKVEAVTSQSRVAGVGHHRADDQPLGVLARIGCR